MLGAGRSGTSMVAGTLAASGYRTGTRLWAPTDANPKGFHEDREVNTINERLLARHTPWVPPGRMGRLWPARLGYLQRWLAILDDDVSPTASERLRGRMAAAVSLEPFALKDPRFCVTLPAWRSVLPSGTRFLVIFREPARTIASTVKEVRAAPYLRSVAFDDRRAEALWQQCYERALGMADDSREWMFVHYDQVLDGSAIGGLASFLEASIDDSFVEPALQRTDDRGTIAPATIDLYARLCQRAAFERVG